MKIVFSGGGTLGPVTPLLAMKDMITEAYPDAQVVWVGTRRGPERELVMAQGIPFFEITSGKLRRYLSFWNVMDIGRIVVGFFQSLVFLSKEDPDICISAGGFVSVPLHWAAWLLGIPTWIHQQDVRVGLAIRLMSLPATHITTALALSVPLFSKKKTTWLGNPVRKSILSGSAEAGRKRFHLDADLPVVFATGGGTGSMAVNQFVVESVAQLQGVAQILHLYGKERPHTLMEPAQRQFPYYHPYQFFTDEMSDAYAVADVVVSRGGFGTISELAALGKAAILIPKQGHQDENVTFLDKADAVVLVKEQTSSGHTIASVVKELLHSDRDRKALGKRLHDLLPPAKPADVVALLQQLVGEQAKGGANSPENVV